MYHFTVPQFTPRTFEELHPEPDEVTSLVYLEDSIAKELNLIRSHNKDVHPLGHLPHQEESGSDADGEPRDDAAISEEGDDGTPEGSNEEEDMDEDMVI